MRSFIPFLVALMTSSLLGACKEATAPAAIQVYNHTKDRSIYILMVNGALGPNADPLTGGGKSSCCVSLPEKWRPGLTAKVQWTYDRNSEDDPQLPPQSVDVEIPRYEHPGNIHIHLYDKHKVKIAISNCDPEHPFYPMDTESLLPWKADRTKEDYRKYENPRGPGDGC
jgi:hypothetical protein